VVDGQVEDSEALTGGKVSFYDPFCLKAMQTDEFGRATISLHFANILSKNHAQQKFEVS
jgi:hypothetical protein